MRPPSVDSLARSMTDVDLPHPLLVDAARAAIAAGDPGSARSRAEAMAAAILRPVINGTGVLLHTNLGRAPSRPSPVSGAARYANVELDLVTGTRGSRDRHAAGLLARAAGAEAAMVVNNGAAAILLALAAVAGGREVVVSRGELVEIGGGFRIPEVLASSGARMVEVGTTNRTRLGDYRAALSDDTAVCLKVHPSNYRIVGFTEEVTVGALAGLGPPVVADLGSGLLDAATPWLGGPQPWLAGEPAVRQTLAAGAALVTFSGDKLLGGPQAGVVAGRADLVARCARHPLARALRPGGLTLAHLQETALSYLRGDAASLPLWAMAARSVASLRARAEALGVGDVVDLAGVFGGGTQPGREVPSAGVALAGDHTAALRAWETPIVARVTDGATVIDLRTVDPDDDGTVGKALASCGSAAAAGDA
ncbi:L-seryl-tRNA(Sec) selenium transferase [Acidiferrimicrobium sp. IK]|uniref:L-seryl-tRNA(Sec) selenium transferase n=1 Tax=Acidiferrimicrobium sp. IK TaxID=2871700 RepID=UPI0021CAE555|nr:L-seryl-tRNA(Sec) selenium transferase [Acidiferrimicrobium sp. IK]MCU4186227.1 L-seryl-tRNA(Sec) selenium transferase [Acidiferrimicrobium sp. IK]